MRVSRPLDLQEKNPRESRVLTYFALYYLLKDHLGSTRVMVDNLGRVKEYINYDPFGEVLESWASYSEPLTFTGKQRDQHSTFDFYYFGSRYYDYRIGQFASVDKAGQFAGGYLYGGNNPIIGVDRDGNLFFIPFLVGALYGSAFSVASYTVSTAITGDWENYGKNLGKAALGGALGGGIGGVFSQMGGQLANNLSYKLLSNAVSNATTSAIMGQDISLNGLIGMTAGGLISYKMMGNYNYDATTGRLGNAFSEIAHTSLSSAYSSVAGGMVNNLLSGRNMFLGFSENLRYGALGGLSSAVAKDIILGTPIAVSGNTEGGQKASRGLTNLNNDVQMRYSPLYRSGGLWGVFHGLFASGYAGFGRDLLIYDKNNPNVWVEETIHYWQGMRNGWAQNLAQTFVELLRYGQTDVYNQIFTREWEASRFTDYYLSY